MTAHGFRVGLQIAILHGPPGIEIQLRFRRFPGVKFQFAFQKPTFEVDSSLGMNMLPLEIELRIGIQNLPCGVDISIGVKELPFRVDFKNHLGSSCGCISRAIFKVDSSLGTEMPTCGIKLYAGFRKVSCGEEVFVGFKMLPFRVDFKNHLGSSCGLHFKSQHLRWI